MTYWVLAQSEKDNIILIGFEDEYEALTCGDAMSSYSYIDIIPIGEMSLIDAMNDSSAFGYIHYINFDDKWHMMKAVDYRFIHRDN
jgi:hypothetical protein